MANCIKIKRESKRICAGSMKRRVDLYTRTIGTPSGGSVDFDEGLSTPVRLSAMVETINGKTIFDDTNVEQIVTHNVYIRYMKNLTSENWLSLIPIDSSDEIYLRILKIENLNEENKFLKLICNERGSTSQATNLV